MRQPPSVAPAEPSSAAAESSPPAEEAPPPAGPPAAVPEPSPTAPADVAPTEAALEEPAGAGELYVNATPWAHVIVDGHAAGETPVTLQLPSGSHSVRVVHPKFGTRDRVVEVRPGRRASWIPKLGP
jgi:serine/threonine-protein kinase